MKEDLTNSDIPLSQYAKESIEKTLDDEKMRNQIKKDLLVNPRYKSYFKQFNKYSVENFIDSYSQRKTSWLRYGSLYIEMEEDRLIQYKISAEKLLWDIQHKKLFDLECLWRANKIKIPKIRVTSDFFCWHELIENCPFLSPVSQHEFEVFLEFLKSDKFDGDDCQSGWNDYYDYKENFELLPEWFQFYDNKFGTGGLLTLPDERGEREEFYLNLARQHDLADYIPPDTDKPQKPDIPWGYDGYEDFIKRFEDRKTLQYMRSMESHLNLFERFDQLERALEILKEAEEIVPVETNSSWYDAILKAASKYENTQIINNLVNVYEEYLFRINNGLGFAEEPGKMETLQEDFSERRIKLILKGMEVNGEVADLRNL